MRPLELVSRCRYLLLRATLRSCAAARPWPKLGQARSYQIRCISQRAGPSPRAQLCATSSASKSQCPEDVAPVPILSEAAKKRLESYLALVLEKNKVMNLTAVRDEAEAWDRHIIDSAALLPVLEAAAAGFRSPKLRVLDVGSGAGLPGIVFAILKPAWQVTLLEATKKKCAFLEEVTTGLQLSNVKIVAQRAEDAGKASQLRERHDIVVARAVAELRTLAELCLPFVKVNGLWIAAKGPNIEDEVNAARNAIGQLGGRIKTITAVDSLSAGVPRTAIVVTKIKATPRQYPRLPGRPNKQPL
ncbi:hypothetical protein WJX74_008062 [Apatococcus lobatus]|uniref:Ribosomal RNA small subunit methyltransferase G n=1 Tax=Apatococcus lobatus TaxID=904363 RepID=A0AAW1RAD2_9CHLO